MPFLDPPELDYVRNKLTQKLVTGGMGGWFVTWTTPAFFGAVPQVLVASEMAERALMMAQELAAPATFRYAGALEGILSGLDPLLDTKVAAVRDRVAMLTGSAAAPPADPAIDPLDDVILNGGLLFWNRSQLRDVGKAMLTVNGRSILVVNGDSGSGKSYTAEWLQHARFRHAGFVLGTPVVADDTSGVATDATGDAAIEADLREMVRQIVKGLDIEPRLGQLPSMAGKSLNQYVNLLSEWIVEHLPANGAATQYWIILDGYGRKDTSPACRALVPALARRVSRPGVLRERVRLVLLDYPTDDLAAARVDQYLREERILPLDVDHVKAAIRAGLTRARQTFTDADIDLLLETARERIAGKQIPVDAPTYLYALNGELRQLLAL
jgi:hypothetical protein